MTSFERAIYNQFRRLAFWPIVRAQERRYEQSLKGKTKNQRYSRSFAGRLATYRNNHSPKRALRSRQYYLRHKERHLTVCRLWKRRNRHKVCHYTNKRRVKMSYNSSAIEKV